jgi:dTDP-4-dehydrorhamnose 3,5-epimerase-like enzyme
MPELKIIELPKIIDLRGNLTFIQNPDQVQFEIKRVYWTYDVPGGEIRGGHAFYEQSELIIAISGSFDVVITKPDGQLLKFNLNRSYYGLFVPKMTWRHIENFSTNSVVLNFSDYKFNVADYIRDFELFKSISL